MIGNDRPVTLTQGQLRTLLEEAAERGAKKALAALGLHDEEAAGDVHDLRGLLDAYRQAKTTFRNAVVRSLTTAFLALLAAGIGVVLWPQK